jgi:rubrerythrin
VHVCKICGYVYEGDPLPEGFVCPLCKHGAEDFEKRVLNEGNEEKKKMTKYVCPVCLYSVEAEEKPEKCIICGAEMNEAKK